MLRQDEQKLNITDQYYFDEGYFFIIPCDPSDLSKFKENQEGALQSKGRYGRHPQPFDFTLKLYVPETEFKDDSKENLAKQVYIQDQSLVGCLTDCPTKDKLSQDITRCLKYLDKRKLNPEKKNKVKISVFNPKSGGTEGAKSHWSPLTLVKEEYFKNAPSSNSFTNFQNVQNIILLFENQLADLLKPEALAKIKETNSTKVAKYQPKKKVGVEKISKKRPTRASSSASQNHSFMPVQINQFQFPAAAPTPGFSAPMPAAAPVGFSPYVGTGISLADLLDGRASTPSAPPAAFPYSYPYQPGYAGGMLQYPYCGQPFYGMPSHPGHFGMQPYMPMGYQGPAGLSAMSAVSASSGPAPAPIADAPKSSASSSSSSSRSSSSSSSSSSGSILGRLVAQQPAAVDLYDPDPEKSPDAPPATAAMSVDDEPDAVPSEKRRKLSNGLFVPVYGKGSNEELKHDKGVLKP